MTQVVSAAVARTRGFIRRQTYNFKVVVTRQALSAFLGQLTFQYDSIYTVALGADSIQLGTVNSKGMTAC